jgi:hypothetical protein
VSFGISSLYVVQSQRYKYLDVQLLATIKHLTLEMNSPKLLLLLAALVNFALAQQGYEGNENLFIGELSCL